MPKKISSQQSLFSGQGTENEENWLASLLEFFEISNLEQWPDALGDALVGWNKSKRPDKKPKVLSLFSGAGGLDIGFHDAGFNIIECNEIEKAFSATLVENSTENKRLSGTKVVCADIKNYYPEIADIDFIIGGPPCQTFSAAGARASGVQGLDDDRGNLFSEYVRILKTLKPKGFLFENVYRIIGAQGGKPWGLIQKAFQEAGYTLFWRILDAADYGVPQHRERLIIIGLKTGEYRFPLPTHGPDSPNSAKYHTAGLAVSKIQSMSKVSAVGGRHGHLLNDIPAGLNYSFYTEKFDHPTPIFGWRSKFSDYLYKANPEAPIRTLKAQGGQYTGPFHWDSRTFSIEELKRLQTFPDNYQMIGSRQKVIHQLGNSVPPQLARILAMSIRQQIFDYTYPAVIQLMHPSQKLGFRARKSELTKIYAASAKKAISKLGKNRIKTCNNSKGEFHGKLSENLQLSINSIHTFPNDDQLNYSIDNKKWVISVGDPSKKPFYSIYVTPHAKRSDTRQIESLQMTSYSRDIKSPLLIWKFCEYLISEKIGKDDLIQLFGYYQYQRSYHFELVFHQKPSKHNSYWEFFAKLTSGLCVGETIDLATFADEYNIKIEAIPELLVRFKNIGFEIRNSNTNPQIPASMILIPYSFPTLNHRSLQRFTVL